MKLGALALLLLAALPPRDGTVIVTAANASIAVREIELSAGAGGLEIRYVDADGKAGSLKAADVVEIAFNGGRAASSSRPAADDIEIQLTTGDILAGKVGAKSDDGVNVVSPVFSDSLVKFGQIRSVLFPANKAFLPLRLPDKADTADIVLTQSGDRAEGTVLSISSAGVLYKSRRLDTEVTVPVAKAAGVWLTETEAPPKEPAGLHATVLTGDGSSLRGEIQSLRDGALTMKDLYGGVRKIPVNLLSGLYVKNGRVVYLSDLRPGDVDEDANYIRGAKKSASDLEFPWQRDRSARGTTIVLGGVEHRKGVGVRARSKLTYALDGGFQRFQAVFGLDATSNGLGAVRAEVEVDGRKVQEITLKGADAPRPIDVDIAGAKELKLLVTWAGYGQSDFADWGSARLIR